MNGLSVTNKVEKDDSWDDNGDDGWGDDDDDLDLSGGGATKPVPAISNMPTPRVAAPTPSKNLFAAGGDDDFFGGFDSKKPVVASLRKPTGGKLVIPKKKEKPAVKKLSVDEDKISDGWDDF